MDGAAPEVLDVGAAAGAPATGVGAPSAAGPSGALVSEVEGAEVEGGGAVGSGGAAGRWPPGREGAPESNPATAGVEVLSGRAPLPDPSGRTDIGGGPEAAPGLGAGAERRAGGGGGTLGFTFGAAAPGGELALELALGNAAPLGAAAFDVALAFWLGFALGFLPGFVLSLVLGFGEAFAAFGSGGGTLGLARAERDERVFSPRGLSGTDAETAALLLGGACLMTSVTSSPIGLVTARSATASAMTESAAKGSAAKGSAATGSAATGSTPSGLVTTSRPIGSVTASSRAGGLRRALSGAGPLPRAGFVLTDGGFVPRRGGGGVAGLLGFFGIPFPSSSTQGIRAYSYSSSPSSASSLVKKLS